MPRYEAICVRCGKVRLLKQPPQSATCLACAKRANHRLHRGAAIEPLLKTIAQILRRIRGYLERGRTSADPYGDSIGALDEYLISLEGECRGLLDEASAARTKLVGPH